MSKPCRTRSSSFAVIRSAGAASTLSILSVLCTGTSPAIGLLHAWQRSTSASWQAQKFEQMKMSRVASSALSPVRTSGGSFAFKTR